MILLAVLPLTVGLAGVEEAPSLGFLDRPSPLDVRGLTASDSGFRPWGHASLQGYPLLRNFVILTIIAEVGEAGHPTAASGRSPPA
jgi:hypothetical protein